MISSMRSMAPKIMLLVLVAFLGTIFLDWGMNRGSATSRMTSAGKINGRDVPLTYFDQQVNLQRQELEKGNPDLDERSRYIPQQIWEQEIQKALLTSVIRKLNLYSSADEVFDFLKHNPIGGVDTAAQFKTNGVFDTNKYVALLNDPRTYENNPGLVQFEQNYRQFVLPVQKLETLLSAVSAPSRAEAEYIYRSRSDKALFEYAYVKSGPIPVDSAMVTPEMVTRYYTAHKDTFKCNNQADLYFVRISKAPTRDDETASYRDMLAAKNKIMGAKNKVDAFIEENNLWNDDDQTATNGGDLGWVTPGTRDPDFDSAAFKLDAGMVSDPILTRMGHELIFVEKKEIDGKTRKIMARHIVRKISANIDSLSEMTDSLRRMMQDIGFVKAAAEFARNNPVVQFDSSGLFERNNPVPGIGYLPGLGRFVWGPESKEVDAISERLENKEGYYLLAVKQRIAKGTFPLDVAKPMVMRIIADSIQKVALRARAEAMLKKVEGDIPLATMKETAMNEIGSGRTDTVTLLSYIPEIGQNTPVAAAAFALPVGKRSGLIKYGDGFFIVRTLWKGPESVINWDSPEISRIMAQKMNETKGRIFEKWYLDQKKKMKIVSNIDKIYLD